MNYHFEAFRYDAKQKQLEHEGIPVELTKKCHDLLVYLLENPSQLIDRDALIEHVWGGRVVTHNTIDQCILKLRKALNTAQPGDYIESVYGQGIRFLPAIEQQHTTQTPSKKQKHNKIWLFLLLITLTIPLGYWLSADKETNEIASWQSSSTAHNASKSAVPQKAAKDDWLLDGGSTYLGYLLHLYPQIELQKIQRIRTTDTQKPRLTIDLIVAKQTDWVVHIDLYQQPNDEGSINNYHADLSLSKSGIEVEQTQLISARLSMLFPQIADWVAQQDGLESPQQIIDANVFTQNESALLSFFQGLTEQIKGNSEQALVYYTQATEADPRFKLAWYETAIALRKQGDTKKAISVLNAINSNDQWLTFRVAVAKGITLNILDEPEAANQAYEAALESAEATNNTDGMAAIYINQAILYSDMNQYDEAEQRLLLALDLPDMSMQHRRYGSIMNTYAKVAANMNNLPLAIEQSKAAIQAYQHSGNLRYEMLAKSRLAGWLIDANQFQTAEKLVKESLSYAKQLNNPRSISSNRSKLAMIYQQTGRFNLALEQWQDVLELNTKLDLLAYKIDAYHWMMKLHLADNNLIQAKTVIDLVEQMTAENPDANWQVELASLKLMLAIHQEDQNQATKLSQQLLPSFPDRMLVYLGDSARLAGNDSEAEKHYLTAVQAFSQPVKPLPLSESLNRLNDLYLNYKPHLLIANIEQTRALEPFIYPLQKYQAVAAFNNDDQIKAMSLMQELKLKAGDYWQATDQQLLTAMHNTQEVP
ncbi:tetratricopeptide repeat protein [Marinicella sp. S1101]|uniref:winged helix-turn-helix domain-containing protein n=1 Tax=Marinicella marina TaxID=2996016 RepID=UPI0022609A80|nr:winged helix-turn-helix domain-containing protein [Marinicella marina]MCX7553689.1 tetratricopeptide repeat protein [Marinicella marina]MDJ1140779.1 tetratricopeptide repeat protein [Marinicella marina]